MHYNGKQKLKLMVLQGLLTNERLRSSHPLSELVVNGHPFPEIHPTGETDSLNGRTRLSQFQYDIPPTTKNQSNYLLEFKAKEALEFPVPNAALVLVLHYETPLKKVINIQYYSSASEKQ